ncbi:MAG: RluA family pseudouridine synthase [Lentihominibacter sp.]|jgi:23S rRNA pseudouridine1911/1915/1917 synthase
MTTFKHTAIKEDEGREVREIMKIYFDFSSRLRNRIKRERLLLLNGADTEGWHKVGEGDVISVTLPDEKSCFEPQDIPVYPVFEDDAILVLNKQPGLVVHPTRGYPDGTVANALMHYMEQKGESWKVRFVNRLDMDTSGLLLVAKNAYAQNHITSQMRANSIQKRYTAIVCGVIDEERGAIDLPIGRPNAADVRRGVVKDGAPSLTRYAVLQRFKDHTLVELSLETGRTHQIRVHMSHIGHPVLGDKLYGGENDNLITRQALHASKLSFIHPITKEPLDTEAPIPDDMQNCLEKLVFDFVPEVVVLESD